MEQGLISGETMHGCQTRYRVSSCIIHVNHRLIVGSFIYSVGFITGLNNILHGVVGRGYTLAMGFLQISMA
jgi:hypothetical protein